MWLGLITLGIVIGIPLWFSNAVAARMFGSLNGLSDARVVILGISGQDRSGILDKKNWGIL